jgi:DNA topoisomerase VI subunit B
MSALVFITSNTTTTTTTIITTTTTTTTIITISLILPAGSNSKELVDTLYALGMCCGVLADQQRQQQQQQQQQQQSRLEYLSRALSIIDTYALSFGNILPLLLQVLIFLIVVCDA